MSACAALSLPVRFSTIDLRWAALSDAAAAVCGDGAATSGSRLLLPEFGGDVAGPPPPPPPLMLNLAPAGEADWPRELTTGIFVRPPLPPQPPRTDDGVEADMADGAPASSLSVNVPCLWFI